jgi:NADH:ubiquinone oxidoreductase subunit 5 (subunit L)/multisubunit Na+/H+ antiporter MnhA subunit
MMEWETGMMVAALGLPWVALLVVQGRGSWLEGNRLGRWLWLVPAFVTATLIWRVAAQPAGTIEVARLLDWLPEKGIGIDLHVDGLSLFFGLVVSGMGTLIFLYTKGYFSDKPKEMKLFNSYLLFFMAAMLGTVFSGNLLSLYIWWELTGIASFFLIGYLHESDEARKGARMALITTISTGMCLLAGILLVGLTAGTFSITELVERAPEMAGSGTWQAGFVLIMIGAFGKSAQFPFHYWLPNAMSAPTPVSAYLHSATMVKLGVFLVARTYPIFSDLDMWAPLLMCVGFTTFLLGAGFSLLSNNLKAILAYSTVSQLGFLIGFYGMSPAGGTHWDLLHISNHVLYKGALFMVVGVIDHATGIKDIRQLGGLRRRLPLLFWISLISAASMAGFIGTTGFLSKEYMLKEKLDYLSDGVFLNAFPIILVIIGSIFKVAFSARFVLHVFAGPESPKAVAHFHKPGFLLQLPALILTSMTLIGGLFPALTSRVLTAFVSPGLQATQVDKLKIWHGFGSTAFQISCAILVAGFILYAIAQKTAWRWAEIPGWIRFDNGFTKGMDGLPAAGASITRWLGVEHPKFHLPVIIGVALIWVGIPLLSAPAMPALPAFGESEVMVTLLATAIIVCAGLCLLIVRAWQAQVILMGVIGFLVTFYFVLFRAPDLALTQILVESASLLLLLVLLQRFPSLRTLKSGMSRLRKSINAVIAVGAGALVFCLTLVFTGDPASAPLGHEYLEASLPKAKGTNAVNTILVDFRGIDTLLEIGVLVIATLGILGLLIRRQPTKPNA